jgi:hypothetical protein
MAYLKQFVISGIMANLKISQRALKIEHRKLHDGFIIATRIIDN